MDQNQFGWACKVSNDDEARKTVRHQINDGANFIKVYSRLPREAYFGIATNAKKEISHLQVIYQLKSLLMKLYPQVKKVQSIFMECWKLVVKKRTIT